MDDTLKRLLDVEVRAEQIARQADKALTFLLKHQALERPRCTTISHQRVPKRI